MDNISEEEVDQLVPAKRSELKCFTFTDLRKATREFHPYSVLGDGGFGSVYKGWINENTYAAAKWGTGMAIAVKKLNLEGFQGHREFLSEIVFLRILCHPNLVNLIGYCVEEEQRILVYEFMSQGSLETQLVRGEFLKLISSNKVGCFFLLEDYASRKLSNSIEIGDSYSQPLSWTRRIKLALGAAKGLAYLHSPEARVMCCDFKSANLLIDSNYDAKLSDFGLAMYIPERRRVNDNTLPKREQNLVSWARPYLTSQLKIMDIMDPDIQGQYTVKAASRAASIAHKCLSVHPERRPDANQVVKALKKLQDLENSGYSEPSRWPRSITLIKFLKLEGRGGTLQSLPAIGVKYNHRFLLNLVRGIDIRRGV
ncbi:hypothetical protein POM88_014268 [Heracleum sosnowskyi]|uniref:non-specific serine/threonine protein kinase n=1 Tax=Heracleum sosnowskyi TaxID=360622 RepID=A0AAD8J030_9APIA|nr:hypothetical protein POM88_014268 [Heracleum sosnowskyi]